MYQHEYFMKVSHEILLQKLDHYDIHGKVNESDFIYLVGGNMFLFLDIVHQRK